LPSRRHHRLARIARRALCWQIIAVVVVSSTAVALTMSMYIAARRDIVADRSTAARA
jgi:predicted lysophospholipase L1 biosynthesis ABC-type transport system permease subunit